MGGDDGAGSVAGCAGRTLQPACGQANVTNATRKRMVILQCLLTIDDLCLPDLLYSLPARAAQPHISYFDCICLCPYNQVRMPSGG